jgi:hypothetical protein
VLGRKNRLHPIVVTVHVQKTVEADVRNPWDIKRIGKRTPESARLEHEFLGGDRSSHPSG